ncbi:hypothetical protein GCM10010231_27510 [Streptomyces sindenensis]|nr:hypothetical protein GCM10010231_27510 [Streptomyces sindenensis]
MVEKRHAPADVPVGAAGCSGRAAPPDRGMRGRTADGAPRVREARRPVPRQRPAWSAAASSAVSGWSAKMPSMPVAK